MKKTALLSFLLSFYFLTHAQVPVNDSISLNASYASMSFYSMAGGETANVNAKDWDLQFWTNLMDAGIRVNDGASVMLYRLQSDDTSAWNTVDTTGMTPLYNSDTSWAIGAFNALASGQFDYGWGVYDQVSHNVKGTRIFVVKTFNGNYKKVWIKQLVSGVNYDIRISNLDNSGEETVLLNKNDYPGKEFFYYAIDSAEVKDIEPVKTAWDLVFRRYQTYVSFPPPAQYYTVMGVLSNPAVSVAEVRGVDVNSNDTTGLTYDDNISAIGSDWKNFNQSVFQWEFVDSLAYFVAAQDGNIYKTVFTGFGGAGTGKVFFNKTLLPRQSTGINGAERIQSLTVYPNPANDAVNALFTLKANAKVEIKIVDLAGKNHFSANVTGREGLNNIALNTAALEQGFYLLSVNEGGSKLTYKFIKQ